MRTTIDLEDDLFRKAKVEAAKRGISLRELMSSALEEELRRPPQIVREHRATFPIFKSKSDHPLHIDEDLIKKLQEEDDVRRSGILD